MVDKKNFFNWQKREKLVQEAIEKGHTFKGKLVKSKIVGYYDNRYKKEISYDLGTYEYQYKNKTYKAKAAARLGHLKKEIDLFYVKKPRKAAAAVDIGESDISWIKHFIVTYILVYWYITRI